MQATPAASESPLNGIKVVDVSSLGPGPFCSMLLSDYGATVVSIKNPETKLLDPAPLFSRGKREITLDLRTERGVDIVRRLAAGADVFTEGFRPGTMERRGLGPEVLLADNPRLVYLRLTGWGQHGPYALRAGHDINYISIAGMLGAIGTDRPVPPLNLLGDFAGGSMNAVIGVLLALLERSHTGVGRVVDAAMVDGAAMLLAAQLGEYAAGQWHGRGTSLLSGAAPFYTVYQCADGGWFAVGAIEPKFYDALVTGLGLELERLPDRMDETYWATLRETFADAFASRTRDQWTAVFAKIDACATPVLDIAELDADPHLRARGTVAAHHGILQAAPSPRLGRAPFPVLARPQEQHADQAERVGELLREFGLSQSDIVDLER